MSNKFVLITSFYLSKGYGQKDFERNKELLFALKKNIQCKAFRQIHLFVESDEDVANLNDILKYNDGKVVIVNFGKQPKYQDYFHYANTNLCGWFCMVCNSDIYLKNIDLSILSCLSNKVVFSLTRYERNFTYELVKNYIGSHDSFIFLSPLPSKFVEATNYYQNLWGSENVTIYELRQNGLRVLNPCYQIVTIHCHQSEVRDPNRASINVNGRSGGSKPLFMFQPLSVFSFIRQPFLFRMAIIYYYQKLRKRIVSLRIKFSFMGL